MMRIAGRWRITQADLWNCGALNLVVPAFIEFAEDRSGSFGFIAVQGEMGYRGTGGRVWSSPGRATMRQPWLSLVKTPRPRGSGPS